jgi:hypothetical protein
MNTINIYMWQLYAKLLDWIKGTRSKEPTEMEKKIKKCEEFRIKRKMRQTTSCPDFKEINHIEKS